MFRKFIAFILCILIGCSDEHVDPWDGFIFFNSEYDVDTLIKSTQFSTSGLSKGGVDLNEASGIAESHINSFSLWTHDDSGNSNYIYLVDELTAEIKATYCVNGISNTDWEDISVAPGKNAGEYYIYLADIGDNTSSRPSVSIFVFPEPIFIESHRGKIIDIFPKVERFQLAYPGGPRDAEAIMVDPLIKDIFIISKYGERSLLYVARYPQIENSVFQMMEVGSFPFREVVAGDISPDGKEVLIKNYEKIFYWKSTNREPLWRLLSANPTLATYNPVEAQGEAICFGANGFFTLSEKKGGVSPVFFFYEKEF